MSDLLKREGLSLLFNGPNEEKVKKSLENRWAFLFGLYQSTHDFVCEKLFVKLFDSIIK